MSEMHREFRWFELLTASASVGLLAALAGTGCGGAGTPHTAPQHAQHDDPARPHGDGAQQADPRGFSTQGNFADLVAALRRTDDASRGDSERGCLLDFSRGRLEADLGAAVHPIPGPPSELDRALRAHRTPIRVLTRHGDVGAGADDLVLAALTSVPPDVHHKVVSIFVLTNERLYVRSTAADATPADLPLDGFRNALDLRGVSEFVLTAEAEVPLSVVRDLLSLLDASGAQGTLAVAFAEGTRLPPAAPRSQLTQPQCVVGNGNAADSPPVADLQIGRTSREIERVRGVIQPCVAHGAFRPGQMEVRLDVAENGTLSNICVTSDTTEDDALRQCVLEALRPVVMPHLMTPESYYVRTPLVFEATGAVRRRPLCDAP